MAHNQMAPSRTAGPAHARLFIRAPASATMVHHRPADETGRHRFRATEEEGSFMNYHELEKHTVAKLREMAKAYSDVEGTSGMHKDQLLDLLCERMGIEKPHKVAVGIDKAKIKAEIRVLKKVRDEAITKRDREKMTETRKKIHKLRHALHKATRIAG
jgi:hypothetical protein